MKVLASRMKLRQKGLSLDGGDLKHRERLVNAGAASMKEEAPAKNLRGRRMNLGQRLRNEIGWWDRGAAAPKPVARSFQSRYPLTPSFPPAAIETRLAPLSL